MRTFCQSPTAHYKLSVKHSLQSLQDIWDEFLPEHHALKSRNLLVMENTQPDNFSFKYLLVHKENKLVGLIYLQEVKIVDQHFNGTALGKPGLSWLKKSINHHFSNVIICGNLFRVHFPGFYFSDKADASMVFNLLLNYLESDPANKRFCGILLKDCNHYFQTIAGFKPYHDDVTMEIDIDPQWKSLEGYKNSLSKKYRQRFNKIREVRKGVEVNELALEEIQEKASVIHNLYLNVALKQSLSIGFVNADYFIQMKLQMGDDFVLTGYFKEDVMVGFSTYIFYPSKAMEIHFIGLDYNFNEQFCIYFNMLFDGLETAIMRSSTKLELGRTARVAKASLGAMPVKVNNYLYLRKGIPSLAFSFFNRWFLKSVGESWMNRSPFKTRES